jgi:hypothetical protein
VDDRVPGYLGRVLDEDGTPAGTCFQVAQGVLVTACHVLSEIGSGYEGASVEVDSLAGGEPFSTIVVRVDPQRDVAVLTSDTGLPTATGSLAMSDQVPPRTPVTVTGHAMPDDPGHAYRFLTAPGEWAGGTARDDGVRLGRMTSSAVVLGMSGAPVIRDGDGAVAGMVSSRYNSADGWLAGTAWVARTEDLLELLTGIASVPIAPPLSAGHGTRPVRLLPRPTFLAGREELLAQLHTQLSTPNPLEPRLVVLYGMGGCGKTSAALEYAYRHLAEFGFVWQFSAEEPAALAAGFGDLAAQLGTAAPGAGDPVARVHAALAAWPGDCLLIFDNAPSPAAIRHALPPVGRVRVLVTSQDPHWLGGQALEVPVLDQETAARFLQARTEDTDAAAAGELAAELGGLPLALEQAAAYMVAVGRGIAAYVDLFRQRREDLLARGEPAGYGKRVATTWSLAFDQLQRTVPLSIALLRLLACCAPERIPLRLLLRPRPGLADSLPAELTPLLDDVLAADDALAGLRRFSLVSAPRDGLTSVHRLVQAITIGHLDGDQASAWRQAARSLIAAALPDEPEDPQTWPAYAALLPHAEIALPADSAGMTQLARFLSHSGNYSAARDLIRHVADACEQALGAGHLDTLTARAHLASWTGGAGDAAGARDQFAALLPVAERVLGAEHPGIVPFRGNLARWTGRAGDAASARDQLAALLPVIERLSGVERRTGLAVRGDLARWTGEAGDAAGARDQHAALLQVFEQSSGPDHPDTLTSRCALARWTGEAGDSIGARDQFAALLPVMERVFGSEHPDTLTARANLASFTGRAGDAADARDQCAALLSVRERVSGPEHPDTLTERAHLARWTGEAGDAAGARDQYAALLSVRERVSGPEHPDTVSERANLAVFTGMAGDAAGARDQYAALLRITERVSGPDHPATLAVRANLAAWTGEAGDVASARDQFAALLPLIEQVRGAEHPSALTARANLARWIGEAGDPAGARDRFAALVPVFERVFGPGHPTTLIARASLTAFTEQAGRVLTHRLRHMD